MKYLLYGNGASGNHGCEAIVRGTLELLGKKADDCCIYSDSVDQDLKYGLSELAVVKPAKSEIKKGFAFFYSYLLLKLGIDYTSMDGLYYEKGIHDAKGKYDVALSCGGDNYCYGDPGIYGYLNKQYQKAGLKTVLWGCSVEPAVLEDNKTKSDLQRYNLIVARESITYEALKKVNRNTILAPDPAFCMKPKQCELNPLFQKGNVIGINLSPMIISNEKTKNIAFDNYRTLIKYLLENTTYNIALIPHVVWESNDDRIPLKELYDVFSSSQRVTLIEDHPADQLKYIISKCRMFIGARTHATIAAYSTCVPTLVVGYSVKARGIARDLFGMGKNYVIPVQTLANQTDLVDAFKWIMENESVIREHLQTKMPVYIDGLEAADKALENLENCK